jgi:hypothetical protein
MTPIIGQATGRCRSPSSSSNGAVGTRINLPNRNTGVGHWPVRTNSYAALRPIPNIRPAVGRSTTVGNSRASSPVKTDHLQRRAAGTKVTRSLHDRIHQQRAPAHDTKVRKRSSGLQGT